MEREQAEVSLGNPARRTFSIRTDLDPGSMECLPGPLDIRLRSRLFAPYG